MRCPRCGAALAVRWVAVADEPLGGVASGPADPAATHLLFVDCPRCGASETLTRPELVRWLTQAVKRQLKAGARAEPPPPRT